MVAATQYSSAEYLFVIVYLHQYSHAKVLWAVQFFYQRSMIIHWLAECFKTHMPYSHGHSLNNPFIVSRPEPALWLKRHTSRKGMYEVGSYNCHISHHHRERAVAKCVLCCFCSVTTMHQLTQAVAASLLSTRETEMVCLRKAITSVATYWTILCTHSAEMRQESW